MKFPRKSLRIGIVALLVVALGAGVVAQSRSSRAPAKKPTVVAKQASGESGLVGIKLFDSGTRIIAMYGNPSQILPATVATGGAGPSAGASAPSAGRGGGFAGGGAPSGPGGGGPSGGGGAGAAGAQGMYDPFPLQFPPNDFNQNTLGGKSGGGGGQSGPPTTPMAAGASGGSAPSGGTSGGGGGAGAMGGGGGDTVTFTRWIYDRGGSRYSFIVNRFGQVVQIEAVGLADSRVRTARGIRLGATFGDILKAYGPPDSYEISGENILMLYLTRRKVGFRLSRVQPGKPQRVTGVVVAAGS